MLKKREQLLIQKAKRGDADAMEALIQGHQASLYHFMLRVTGSPHLAEDVAQEAFVRVLKNLHRFDDTYRFSTWLFTIARRLWINMCQKRKPTFDSAFIGYAEGDTCGPVECFEADASDDYRREAVSVALECLTKQQQEIVMLYHANNCSVSQISERQGIPQGTVKSHLFRARKRMAGALEDSGFDIEDLIGSVSS
jgi:RNA polymerase sigma-70 factor (ECF subfamily)